MGSAQFWEKYCILCLLSLCEIFVCCELEFGVFLFVMLLNWRSKTITDVKHFEFRLSNAVNHSKLL